MILHPRAGPGLHRDTGTRAGREEKAGRQGGRPGSKSGLRRRPGRDLKEGEVEGRTAMGRSPARCGDTGQGGAGGQRERRSS